MLEAGLPINPDFCSATDKFISATADGILREYLGEPWVFASFIYANTD